MHPLPIFKKVALLVFGIYFTILKTMVTDDHDVYPTIHDIFTDPYLHNVGQSRNVTVMLETSLIM